GDILVSAPDHFSNGLHYNGAAYVLFGKASGFTADFNLSSLNGSNGFEIDGLNSGDVLGTALSSAGDVNGDGFGDILVSSDRTGPTGYYTYGAAYVVFGKGSGFGATFDLSTLNGTNGFTLNGDYIGPALSAGDVNGDGFSDIILGAPGAYPKGSYSGATYV